MDEAGQANCQWQPSTHSRTQLPANCKNGTPKNGRERRHKVGRYPQSPMEKSRSLSRPQSQANPPPGSHTSIKTPSHMAMSRQHLLLISRHEQWQNHQDQVNTISR
eukprot:6397966-Amphidinium_carterae.1